MIDPVVAQYQKTHTFYADAKKFINKVDRRRWPALIERHRDELCFCEHCEVIRAAGITWKGHEYGCGVHGIVIAQCEVCGAQEVIRNCTCALQFIPLHGPSSQSLCMPLEYRVRWQILLRQVRAHLLRQPHSRIVSVQRCLLNQSGSKLLPDDCRLSSHTYAAPQSGKSHPHASALVAVGQWLRALRR